MINNKRNTLLKMTIFQKQLSMRPTPKNYDVIIAFVIFICCLLCALFFNANNVAVITAGIN